MFQPTEVMWSEQKEAGRKNLTPPTPPPNRYEPSLTPMANQLVWLTFLCLFFQILKYLIWFDFWCFFFLFFLTSESLLAEHKTKTSVQEGPGVCRTSKMLRYLLKTLLQMNLFTDTIRHPSNGSESFFNASLPSFNASMLEWGNFSGFNGRTTHFSSSPDEWWWWWGGSFVMLIENLKAAWKKNV